MLAELHDATKDTVQWIQTPSFDELLDRSTTVDEFPFDFTFDELKDVPFVGMHTSGTTGHPK